MSQPTATSQPTQAPAVTDVTSTGWTGPGIEQSTGSWCFAAAEQMIQRAFGVRRGQPEIAHGVMIARGRIGDTQHRAQAYYEGCRRILNQHNLNDLNWSTVERHVRADQGLYNVLRGAYGTPPLTGRAFSRGNAPDAGRTTATLDAGGLVMIGSSNHWKIVYGYTRAANGDVTYKVYNPISNTASPAASYPTMSGGIEETYYVTG
jgi:hypothetical protein